MWGKELLAYEKFERAFIVGIALLKVEANSDDIREGIVGENFMCEKM